MNVATCVVDSPISNFDGGSNNIDICNFNAVTRLSSDAPGDANTIRIYRER